MRGLEKVLCYSFLGTHQEISLVSPTQSAILILATLCYAAYAFLAGRRFFRPGRANPLEQWGPLILGLMLHASFLVSRGVQAQGLPLQTRLDSIALFLWFTAIGFAVSERVYGLAAPAPIMWPVYALCMTGMLLLAGREPLDRPSLKRTWLLLHLVPVYIAYAGFAVAAGTGLAYLLQERLLRGRGASALWRKLPSLERLNRLSASSVSFGFTFFTIGLAVGLIWAKWNESLLGRKWYLDPKVVAGIVVWLIYSAVLHLQLLGRWRGRRAAVLTIAGFVLALATFAAAHSYPAARAVSQVFASVLGGP